MSHPQLEKLAEVIGDALGDIGVLDTSWDEDCQVAKAVLDAGFVIPQVKLPTFVPAADYSPDSPHYGKPHEDCCK